MRSTQKDKKSIPLWQLPEQRAQIIIKKTPTFSKKNNKPSPSLRVKMISLLTVFSSFKTLFAVFTRQGPRYQPHLSTFTWMLKSNQFQTQTHWFKLQVQENQYYSPVKKKTRLNGKLVGGWFQPIWKICSSNWNSSPSKGENKKCLKPPARKSPNFVERRYIFIRGCLFHCHVTLLGSCKKVDLRSRKIWTNTSSWFFVSKLRSLSQRIHGTIVYLPTLTWLTFMGSM